MTPSMLLSSLASPWGSFQLAAVLVGAALWRAQGRSSWPVIAAGIVGAAVGSIALGVVLRAPAMALAGSWRGFEVMAFGALGGLAAGVLVGARRRHACGATALDRVALPMGAMVAVARLGCFHAGCDFGRVSELPWAVRYGVGSPAWFQHRHLGLVSGHATTSAPVHPTQLYEAAVGVVMIAVAWFVGRRRHRRGAVFAASLGTYAAGRALVEIVRADEARGMWGALSMPQWLALVVGASVVWWWTTQEAPSQEAPSQEGQPSRP